MRHSTSHTGDRHNRGHKTAAAHSTALPMLMPPPLRPKKRMGPDAGSPDPPFPSEDVAHHATAAFQITGVGASAPQRTPSCEDPATTILADLQRLPRARVTQEKEGQLGGWRHAGHRLCCPVSPQTFLFHPILLSSLFRESTTGLNTRGGCTAQCIMMDKCK